MNLPPIPTRTSAPLLTRRAVLKRRMRQRKPRPVRQSWPMPRSRSLCYA